MPATCLGATPCPKCGNRCDHMAGVNVPQGDIHQAYLVCRGCKVKREVSVGAEWVSLNKAKRWP